MMRNIQNMTQFKINTVNTGIYVMQYCFTDVLSFMYPSSCYIAGVIFLDVSLFCTLAKVANI
jgi:hypothetical protein